MRKLSWISRIFAAAAAIIAAALVIGGSYYVGFVGEVQRGLNDPQSGSQLAVAKIAQIEQTLGYQGYLRAYRTFRLTGDIGAREQMTQHAMDASRTLDSLRGLLQGSPPARLALADIAAVVEEFARVARSAPETPSAALRGTASMDAIDAMPQVPQLESTYLTLRTGLERLRTQTSAYQMGSIAWALTWSQMLVICAFAALVTGLVAAAGLLQIGITQPIKSLTHSLRAVGDGRIDQPVWGTERDDEIGDMARAGEKLRQTLTDASAQGQEEPALPTTAPVEETVRELGTRITEATETLRQAANAFETSHAGHRQSGDDEARRLTGLVARLEEMVEGFGPASEKAQQQTHERLVQLDTVAGQLSDTGSRIAEAFDTISVRTGSAVDGLTNSITAFGRAAEGVHTIQNAFFESCDRISSDAATTSDTLKSLALRLSGILDTTETQRGTRPAEAADDAETEALVSLFHAEETLDLPAPSATMAPISDDHLERLAAILADRLVPGQALAQQVEALRDEIRALALRMTEERILMTAEMPAPALLAESQPLSSSPARTLADIPAGEILERLRRLSDEMAAPEPGDPHEPRSLTENLKAFALRMKPLETAPVPGDELRDMAPELTEHARTIEETACEVAHAAALRGELESITTELRSLASTIQSGEEAPWADLRDTALHLGARAETLSAYLSQKQAAELDLTPAPAFEDPPQIAANGLLEATHDLATLGRIIATLEQRMAELSDEAVAANLAHQTGQVTKDQPEGSEPAAPAADADATIAVVYDAIDRLNNIAAALARAGEANHMRAAANG